MRDRKTTIRAASDRIASQRDGWIARNFFYYQQDSEYMRFLTPPGLRVLDLGCGTGDLLANLKPSKGVGVDFSEHMINIARGKYPELDFSAGDI